MTTMTAIRGGAWLTEDVDADSVLTPERLSEEHRMIGRTADEFMDNEVLPVLERLEQKDWNLARTLVKGFGDLGLLGTDVPESFGGVGLDKAASVVVGESAGRSASFATTYGAQTGLAVTPLLCFGSESQKRKYIPGLVAGDLIGAYALSESGSGSDALSARARAVRQPDGSFVLNGEKMWITNGGFADVFIVFAKVVDDSASDVNGGQFTAFIVERVFPGVSTGN
jgi:alkylation response protein AidB-like acyl-CoA dehydrogenase